MKIAIIILLSISSLGCGRYQHNPEFDPYLMAYEDAIGFGVNITVSFKDDTIEDNFVGACFSDGFFKYILIDEQWWRNNKSEVEKMSLMFHELGHCIQNLPHNASLMVDNCPVSLMYPYTIFKYCLDKHWDYYVEELVR